MTNIAEVLQIFYDNPYSFYLLEGKILKQILLSKQGEMVSKGTVWIIENKKIGPDVYMIWLKKKSKNRIKFD